MDSLEDLQAAIAELERKQKKLINKIKYADQVAEDMRARASRLRAEVDEVQDRLLALIVKERAIKEGEE
jgi:FtsZ-binding cell division protein ZapB